MGTTERLARRMEHWMRRSTLQVRVTHPNPGSAADLPIDPDTDEVIDATADGLVYQGIALQVRGPARPAIEGGTPVELDLEVLHLPLAASTPEVGDLVEWISYSADSAQVGRKLTVSEVDRTAFAPTRRLMVEETAPARARAR